MPPAKNAPNFSIPLPRTLLGGLRWPFRDQECPPPRQISDIQCGSVNALQVLSGDAHAASVGWENRMRRSLDVYGGHSDRTWAVQLLSAVEIGSHPESNANTRTRTPRSENTSRLFSPKARRCAALNRRVRRLHYILVSPYSCHTRLIRLATDDTISSSWKVISLITINSIAGTFLKILAVA